MLLSASILFLTGIVFLTHGNHLYACLVYSSSYKIENYLVICILLSICGLVGLDWVRIHTTTVKDYPNDFLSLSPMRFETVVLPLIAIWKRGYPRRYEKLVSNEATSYIRFRIAKRVWCQCYLIRELSAGPCDISFLSHAIHISQPFAIPTTTQTINRS